MRATDHASRAQKIRRPSSGGGKFRGDFSFRRSLSRTSTLVGSRHLAVSNGRLPDPVSRVTPDANSILRELSRNLHVFFRICHAEKGTEARYRQVLQNRGSTNSSERGTLASVTPRARLLKLSEVPYLLKWGFKPCCKLPISADLSGIWRDLPEFKFSSLLKSHWTNFTSAVVLAYKEIK